jgi:hypothetical protein
MPPGAPAHQDVRQICVVIGLAIAPLVLIAVERANHRGDADVGEAAGALEELNGLGFGAYSPVRRTRIAAGSNT